MRRALGLALLVVLPALSSCATSTTFKGNAFFPGGARGCYDYCRQKAMYMDAFVYIGQYSTACVCRLRGANTNEVRSESLTPAVVGVVLQAQRQREAAAAASAGAAAGIATVH